MFESLGERAPARDKIVAHAPATPYPRGRGASREFIGFIAVGFTATSLTLITRYAYSLVSPFEIAVIASQVTGAIISFVLNRMFVFPTTNRPVAVELGKFAAVAAIALIVTTGISSIVYRLVLPALSISSHVDFIAHATGLAVGVVPTFLAHKFFTFRGSMAHQG